MGQPASSSSSTSSDNNDNKKDSSRETHIGIEIEKDRIEDIKLFLESIPGYQEAYPTTKPNPSGLVRLEVHYNTRFSYWKKREIKREIKGRDGKIVGILDLGDNPPRISQRDKDMLFHSMLLAIMAFIPTLGGALELASLDIVKSIVVSLIAALSAFFARIVEEKVYQSRK
ncbi:MAG: hypothetical protein M3275_00085 [Thermoproteota archaeon]|nr:hypothetical protein [Thermoproteota archaeon]